MLSITVSLPSRNSLQCMIIDNRLVGLTLRFFFIVFLLNFGSKAFADSKTDESRLSLETSVPIDYKLTVSNDSTRTLHAYDVNLRLDQGNQRGWIGYYSEKPTKFEQWRIGYERTDQISVVDVDTSLQAANYGFLGGSITASAGDPFFGMIGYGRTNLKPYANLNFDPNDAITLGLGWKSLEGAIVNWFLVRDDRLVPGQQNLHLLMRSPLSNKRRITIDIIEKSGPSDHGQSIYGLGATITYDWPSYFLRLAYDPKVNFTQENMSRISMGIRF